ncbi:MAG: hypothetical protein HY962_13785 [Ignavibacteriae bacterium]|nr:hypothetical protein [Ignavibacteriota bacterium]
MRSRFLLPATLLLTVLLASCGRQNSRTQETTDMHGATPSVAERLAEYAPVSLATDLSFLTERERALVRTLVEAGTLVDEVFWRQTSPDAIALRDSLGAAGPAAADLSKYVRINYGPYDRIYDGARFVGTGPATKPPVAAYYPQDMSKEEFEDFSTKNPGRKEELEGQYTVVERDGTGFRAVPFAKAYPEVPRIAALLEKAATLADNPSLRKYLRLRAVALLTDDYFASDMAWMDLKENNVDVVIGPIENYEDALFNYKTAYECAVVVKDPAGTRELQMFTGHIDAFEKALPMDPKYIRATAGSGNVLEVVNVVFFGGDFMKGVKTIAASLPNDPRVTQVKGGKKQMYKNLIEAKFDKILVPIAEKLLRPDQRAYVDRAAFTSFVTLHEVSHTLGRGYVFGDDKLSVRRALKERYSAIEECKADLLGLYNNRVLLAEKKITEEQLRKSIVTYVAGLYRSVRFGAEEAHGKSNIMQLNFLVEKGAVSIDADGYVVVKIEGFLDTLGEFARKILTVQAEGDYAGAGVLLDTYGKVPDHVRVSLAKLQGVPRDLDVTFTF